MSGFATEEGVGGLPRMMQLSWCCIPNCIEYCCHVQRSLYGVVFAGEAAGVENSVGARIAAAAAKAECEAGGEREPKKEMS
jgi:hypothetical protein